MSLSGSDDASDAASLIARARLMGDGIDAMAALDLCEQAIAAWPDIADAYRLRLHLARTVGDRARTLDALETLVRYDAEDAESCAALGSLLCETGDFDRAAAVLRPVAARLGDRGEAMSRFVAALAQIGARDELRGLRPQLDRLAASAPSPYAPYAHLASAELAAGVDRDRLLAEIAALRASPRWLDAGEALSLVSGAIAAAKPFSLLRMDPSLAAFVAASGRTAGRLLRPQERLALVDSVWPGWFGVSSRDAGEAVLASLGGELMPAIEAADLVALPDGDALAGDPARFGALAEMHRLARFGTDAAFADSDVVSQMHHLVPYLRTVLAGLPFLGFVGAHPAMFRKLAHFCGVADTRFVLVPRDASFPVAEDGIDPRDFLPDRHAATLAALSVPMQGAVFLVSAPGPLGIVYAARIKALGGIALDIGPLASQWAGG